MLYLIKEKVTKRQILEMMQTHGNYIKVAVDVKREVVAAGGALYSDCEIVLTQNGSHREDIWGA